VVLVHSTCFPVVFFHFRVDEIITTFYVLVPVAFFHFRVDGITSTFYVLVPVGFSISGWTELLVHSHSTCLFRLVFSISGWTELLW
jgi:hypothetical protein